MYWFLFKEKKNYHQLGNGCSEFDIPLRKNGAKFKNVDDDGNDDEPITLLNNAFGFAFSKAKLCTRGGEENKHNKTFWQTSTFLRLLTSKMEI